MMASNQSESSITYPGWKVVLAGFFGVMVSFAAVVPYTFSVFVKPLSAAFGWHREAVSAGFSIAALTVAAASPGLGFLLDRFGPRRIVLPCVAVFCAGYVSLVWLTPHIMHFYIAFFILGVVGNGTAYLGYSRAISTWFVRRRGLALSAMLAGGSCGAMLLPLVAQASIAHYGWRAAYGILGGLAFVVGFPFAAMFLKEQAVALDQTNGVLKQDVTLGEAVGSRIFWIIAITVCLYAASLNGALAHLSAILTDRGVSASGAAAAVSMIGATALVGRLLTGLFLDRFFGVRVSQWMLLITAIGMVLLSLAHSLTAGLFAASLIGFSMGSEGDITPYLLSRYFGLKRLSTLYSLTWTAYAAGAAVSPILVGKLFDSLGSYRPGTIQLLALPAFIPCLLMFLLPRYGKEVSSHTAFQAEPEMHAELG
ncbi:MFS transporter [Occallatibacter savannae]|uniref:MFS transporter n=1 Tax=Occallatibacter savannae TaxID=1002691 RepID=UPI000D68C310|nr:MFS transporter [Occallatibacter savannae]